jgi:Cu/Ag efflux pump CusA
MSDRIYSAISGLLAHLFAFASNDLGVPADKRNALISSVALVMAVAGLLTLCIRIGIVPPDRTVTMKIAVKYSGQTANFMKQNITTPIKREMNQLPRVNVHSVSTRGWSIVMLTFTDVADEAVLRQQVQDRLNRLNQLPLPPGAAPILIALPPDRVPSHEVH